MYENDLKTCGCEVSTTMPKITDNGKRIHDAMAKLSCMANDIETLMFGVQPNNRKEKPEVTCFYAELDAIYEEILETGDALSRIKERL